MTRQFVIARSVIAYPDNHTIGEALSDHYLRSGLPVDGGASSPTVTYPVGRWHVTFPNPQVRRDAIRLHDVQHLALGYGTDWHGEVQIAAWELGSGCGRWIAPWVLATGAFTVGLILAPRLMWKAFLRGRGGRSLYVEPLTGDILTRSLGEIRAHMRVNEPQPTRLDDLVVFLIWTLPAATLLSVITLLSVSLLS